ncbi:hypothetical protein CYLTODRAFT_416565 [Cylindrobasidium torrendii FP15055 ss-10]|uniref:GATA-type domain-containing protein n=1 Tax=Cylindrobasidium torrendii FP15055 ss-10 TaxID=1314674 RepID=A0A0D7BU20_9AGAR|nr:hypothetical protein CYLTODRAFT_416565 [Cylindrobasidium torrendii FP15055 ss-10]
MIPQASSFPPELFPDFCFANDSATNTEETFFNDNAYTGAPLDFSAPFLNHNNHNASFGTPAYSLFAHPPAAPFVKKAKNPYLSMGPASDAIYNNPARLRGLPVDAHVLFAPSHQTYQSAKLASSIRSQQYPSHTPRPSSYDLPSPSSTAESPQSVGQPASTPSPSVSSSKACSHCRTTTTPLWRRDPGTNAVLCNACGLYLQQRGMLRPKQLIDADDEPIHDEADGPEGGPECSHCHTRRTSVWRRSKEGAQLCNACGVYQRLRGKERPIELKKNRIKPRMKHAREKKGSEVPQEVL